MKLPQNKFVVLGRKKHIIRIAESNFKLGEYQEALDGFLKAKTIDDTDLFVQERLGDTYFHIQRSSDSVKCYEEVLNKSSDQILQGRICNSIGNVYFSLENYVLATSFFQKAIEFDPSRNHYYKNLQHSIKKNKEPSKSQQITSVELEKALKRARDFYRIGDINQARLNLKKALRINPEHPDAVKLMASMTVSGKGSAVISTESDHEVRSPDKQVIKRSETLEKTLQEIDYLVGLNNIKEDIEDLISQVKIEHIRAQRGLGRPVFSYHSVFLGPPGTGKTTIARKLGIIYKELGILKEGHLIEADRSKLVAEYVGQTAVKTNQLIDKALDGVLFIDEAYTLSNESNDGYGKEAIDTLLKRMEDDRSRLVVIVAGYSDEMENFLNTNPGLKSRFNRQFEFKHYSLNELLEILRRILSDNHYAIPESSLDKLRNHIKQGLEEEQKSFGNARFVRNLFEELIRIQSRRLSFHTEISDAELTNIQEDDIQELLKVKETDEQTLDDLLKELEGLIGLENVKSEVHSLINFIKVEKEREKHGLKSSSLSLHSVFYGAPGTGKTTVARILAKIFKQLGVLRQGQLIEADRSDLVAGYMGQTAEKTSKLIEKALGGVLFIDEAYSLSSEMNDSYGREAIDTLLKRMEDHRDRFVVIVAGYKEEMKNFIEANPGLQSRFNRYFLFEDFSDAQMFEIFEHFISKQQLILNQEGEIVLKEHFLKLKDARVSNLGNGRYVRNLFELTLREMSNRLSGTQNIDKISLSTIMRADLITAIEQISSQHIK